MRKKVPIPNYVVRENRSNVIFWCRILDVNSHEEEKNKKITQLTGQEGVGNQS